MTQRKIALSIEEAADYTGIGRNTLRKLVEWKKLPVLKVGRKVLIKTDMLELFRHGIITSFFISDRESLILGYKLHNVLNPTIQSSANL